MVKSTESKPLQTGKEQAPKTLKDLTLLDRFLFDQTMEQPEAHEAVLQIILGKENLHLLTPAQTEKELRTAPWLRSIRLDVYSLDQELTVYLFLCPLLQAGQGYRIRRRSHPHIPEYQGNKR